MADENRNDITGTSTAPVELKNDVSGQRYTAVRPGTCYLKYIIYEDVYTSYQNANVYATNASLSGSAALQITVTEPDHDEDLAELVVEGSYEGIANGQPELLCGEYGDENKLSVTAIDRTGKEIEDYTDYEWDPKESKNKGMTLAADGTVTFTKPGYFHVRVKHKLPNGKTLYSAYVEIIANEDSLSGHGGGSAVGYQPYDPSEYPEAGPDTVLEIEGDYTGITGGEPVKLEDWDKLSVSAYDITGKMLDVNYVWEAESSRSGITLTADGTAAFTEGGTYRVRVRSGNVVSLWKEITVLDHAKVTTAPKTYSFVYDGKTHYLLDEPGVAPNGTMVYAVTQSKDEIAAFSDAIPTATEVGVYYVWYKAAGFEGYVDSEAQYLVAAVTDGSVYFAASGEGQEYLHGGNDDAQFTVKRITGDENTFALFTGIQMDGVNVDQTNYEAWQGNVVIRLKNAYLDKLSGGSHILKVLFTDGSVEIPFTVSRTVDPTKFDDVAVPSDSFTFKKVGKAAAKAASTLRSTNRTARCTITALTKRP